VYFGDIVLYFSSKYICKKEIIDQIFQSKKNHKSQRENPPRKKQTSYYTVGLLTDKFKAQLETFTKKLWHSYCQREFPEVHLLCTAQCSL